MSDTEQQKKPSKLAAFFKGYQSGTFNGALMMGIYQLVLFGAKAMEISFFGGLPVVELPTIIVTVMATGLFSGVMAVKRLLTEHESHPAERVADRVAIVPVIGQSMTPQLAVAQASEVEQDAAPTQWASKVGPRQNNIDAILKNGSMTDQDRAAAILAERQQASAAEATR